MGHIKPDTRKGLEEQIIKKVWDDPDFINEISISPSSIIKQEFDVDLAEGTKVFVHKEKVNEIHIVIPKKHSE